MAKKIWQKFGELTNEDAAKKLAQDEFKEELPFEDIDGDMLDAATPRRDFLKYLGFSTAAAALAAGCKIPARRVVPFANKPPDVFPGVPKYYATTYVQDGDIVPVVAKVRDGRPIKIEGNDLCATTGGGTSARAQASVLDLYDTYRNKWPMQRGQDGKFKEVANFQNLDLTIANALKSASGQVVLLTSSIVSPT